MKKIVLGKAVALMMVWVGLLHTPVYAVETLSLEDVLQKVAANYTDIRIAAMQVDKAQQDIRVVQAQVGWNLNASASTAVQPLIGNNPIDQNKASVGVSRQTESGNSVSVTSSYDGTDFAPYFSPTTSLNLNLRIPLGQGRGNAQYQQGVTGAEAGAAIAEANLYLLRDNIARTIMDLYFGAAQTWYSMANARDALDRARQMLDYERKNVRLGLSEQRDLLNRESQLHAAEADLNNMEQLWVQQRTSLNHLMGRPWDAEFVPLVQSPGIPAKGDPVALAQEVEAYNPTLKIRENELRMAESKLQVQTDAQKSRMDVVVGAGMNSNSSGTNTTYSIGFEYQRPVDGDGFDAQMYQAQLERDMADERLKAARKQMQYDLGALLQRIEYTRAAVRANQQRLEAQKQRFADIRQRYNQGRATIAELLMVEAELKGTEFALRQQQIELHRQVATLNLMRGQLWVR